MGYVSLLVTSLDKIMLCGAPLSLLVAALSTAEALHTSCISQKVLLHTAEMKLPVSGPHCAGQLFSSGAWQPGLFATSCVS